MFENNSQKQSAGNNAQQVQIENLTINNGITEKRVHEIMDSNIPKIIDELSAEAKKSAEKRMQSFANELVPSLVEKKVLDTLKDPTMQILIKQAQITSQMTDQESDYKLLSNLITYRASNNKKEIHAYIRKAIDAVPLLTEEALLVVTVLNSLRFVIPLIGNLSDGLDALDKIYESIIENSPVTLPNTLSWCENLEIIGGCRINSILVPSKLGHTLYNMMPGYIDVGILKTSENYHKAIKLLNDANIPENYLVTHELNESYARLNLVNYTSPYNLTLGNDIYTLTEKSSLTITKILSLYKNDTHLKDVHIERFMKQWNQRKNLKLINDWYSTIDIGIDLTSVGRIIAVINAQQYFPSYPALSNL